MFSRTTGLILHAVKYSSETEWMENPTFKSYINISFSHIVFQLKCSYNEGRGDSLARAFKHPDGCQTVIKRRECQTGTSQPQFLYLLGDSPCCERPPLLHTISDVRSFPHCEEC